MSDTVKGNAEAGAKIIGLALESPEQAMKIIKGYIDLVKKVEITCSIISNLIDHGDTDAAKKGLKLMGEGIVGGSIMLLMESTKRVPEEEIERVMAEAGITPDEASKDTPTPNVKMAGNA